MRDHGYWESRCAYLNPSQAESFLRKLFAQPVPAQDPADPRSQVYVSLDENALTHCLYKGNRGGRVAGQQVRGDFLPDRARRLGWIAEALTRPDAIYRVLKYERSGSVTPARGIEHVYLVWTLAWSAGREGYVVCVKQFGRRHVLSTAYIVPEPGEPERRTRSGLWKRVYARPTK